MRVSFPSVLPVNARRSEAPKFGLFGGSPSGNSLGSALLDAVWDRKLDDVKKHVNSGNLNSKTVHGRNSALHIAAMKGNVGIVRFLLSQRGIETSKPNAYGETPRQIAERYSLSDADYKKLRGRNVISGVPDYRRADYREIANLIRLAEGGAPLPAPETPAPAPVPSPLDQLKVAAKAGDSLRVLSLASRILAEGSDEDKRKLLKALQDA